MSDTNLNRRDFLRGVTLSSLGVAMAAQEISAIAAPAAAAAPAPAPTAPPVNCAVVGLGQQGRDILASLAKLGMPVVAVAETYKSPAFVKRATDIVKGTPTVTDDYRTILSDPKVQAVFIATPSHLHKDIAIAAVQAGKNVYCEAPLASSIEDAKAIAQAGAAAKTVFQAGLQFRSNKMHKHVLNFVKGGALGTVAEGRAQYHKKGSWRKPAPSDERAREMSWRMYKATSLGIPGEVGIHQLDAATWFIGSIPDNQRNAFTMPISVIGYGATRLYAGDGMEVPDTVQAIIEYPGNIRYVYDATITNSFDGAYETFNGSDCAMYVRDQRAWMFKETDSPLLGWEVYARKDKAVYGDDYGIMLVADATKLIAQGKEPAKVGQDVSKTALYQAVDSFLNAVRTKGKPDAGALEGYRANVIAAKVHEAIMTGSKITFQKEWFDL